MPSRRVGFAIAPLLLTPLAAFAFAAPTSTLEALTQNVVRNESLYDNLELDLTEVETYIGPDRTVTINGQKSKISTHDETHVRYVRQNGMFRVDVHFVSQDADGAKTTVAASAFST